ncbi:GntR family transcriptional regulator [Candidatus Palauibacter sp.]|uniref:GntR family transcriptional regulator n=1 Tax=Candidatus Palauibacter sp. TaxID=3101350 RepID=UPI003B5183AD
MTGGCGLHPLARDHYIPLRRQLAADLEAGIRDGQVRPGAHLPSSRDLARLLGVDRGTVGAALARLRRRNLIELHSGQRPRAAIGLFRDWPEAGGRSAARHFSAATTRPTARQATLALLRGAHAGGVSRWELLRELERIVRGAGDADARRVTLWEPRAGLRALLATELEATCRVHVHATGSTRLVRAGVPVIVRRELLPRIRRAHRVECLPLALAGGTCEREFVRRRLRRGLVVLLSRSETVRVFGAELAARDFARGISFTALDPARDRQAAERALSAAAVVFHDRLALPYVRPVSVPAMPIRLVPPRELERLDRYLSRAEAEPRRP